MVNKFLRSGRSKPFVIERADGESDCVVDLCILTCSTADEGCTSIIITPLVVGLFVSICLGKKAKAAADEQHNIIRQIFIPIEETFIAQLNAFGGTKRD
jgi:hypothetical protein